MKRKPGKSLRNNVLSESENVAIRFGLAGKASANGNYLSFSCKDAEWILDYEKRLARLQAKTRKAGINPDRLQKLQHQLAELRRSLN